MGEDENKTFYKQKQGINIAFASLLRIGNILDRIVDLDANYPIDSPEKQKSYLNLVRQYLISATPYLSSEDAVKYQKEILSFSVKKKTNVSRGVQKCNFQFDPVLDKRLNEVIVELQLKLRPVFSKVVDDDEDEGL